MADVDLAVTCYHGNQDWLLSHEAITRIRAWAGPNDVMLTLLVNNVRDRHVAMAQAGLLVEAGLVSRAVPVAEHLDRALAASGMRRSDFGRFLHWSDAPLVALALDGPDVLVYWDAGAELMPSSRDWIGPSARLLTTDDRVLTANPRWADVSTVVTELDHRQGRFGLGFGFSDQVFMIRRSRAPRQLRTSVPYWLRSPASVRYPFTGAVLFEQLIDVHMRTAGMRRATFMDAEYAHTASGNDYQPTTVTERISHRRDRAIRQVLAAWPWTDPRLREGGLEPRRQAPAP